MIIGIDGCFSRSICSREFLNVVGRDECNEMVSIAWAVGCIEK